jgi:hypothetical protein
MNTNPEPWALSPVPWTLNPEPWTLKMKMNIKIFRRQFLISIFGWSIFGIDSNIDIVSNLISE